MARKGMVTALLFTTLLASGGASAAEQYRPEEFLKLDLSTAALSPKLLGPANQFEPVTVETKSDPAKSDPAKSEPGKSDTATSESGASEPVKADLVPPQPAKTEAVEADAIVGSAPVRRAKRHVAVRTKLARRHSNPLDAMALDPRIQVWPCRSGGICNWR